MIRPVVGQAAPNYHGNSISANSMPMMFLGGGDKKSDERIQYLRKSVETQRAVRFSTKIVSRAIDSEIELGKKEKKGIWYTKKELGEMLAKNKEIIQLSRKNPSADFCMRGLEDMMSIRASMNKKERRNTVLHAVLEEQRRQKSDEVSNPEKLRKRSKNGSKESVKRALQFAHMDARAALNGSDYQSNDDESLYFTDFPECKKETSWDDCTIATMTTATTVSTVSTVSTASTFGTSSSRRRTVESVVQQPNAPRPSSCDPPMNVIIDTTGFSLDRKPKKLVLCPKEPLTNSSHRGKGSGHKSTRTRTTD